MNDGADVPSASAKLYKQILIMSRQVPESHRRDAHKINFYETLSLAIDGP